MNFVNRLTFPVAAVMCMVLVSSVAATELGSPRTVPQSYQELWGNYDPRKEPLEIEILKEWRQDGVQLQVLRYRVATFKGVPARVAAIFGFPVGQQSLPGLVQIHGGGQYADANAVLTNAQRGYATISIAWAGRINASQYRVDPKKVQLFWENDPQAPGYLATTDWGLLDGYHAPSKNAGNVFPSIKAQPWTMDVQESPRNSGWYLSALAARRALTFLESQDNVDANRLGVYGHSMGGKLTVLTATDRRVKAAAPSCGGVSDRRNKSPLFQKTLGDENYLKRVNCPIFFLSPANDFHGTIDDLQLALDEIQSDDWRITCSPHHNHQDNANSEVATQIWFDQHLKGKFVTPNTPKCELTIDRETGLANVTVHASTGLPIRSVDVFYSRHGRETDEEKDRNNTMARFWYHLPIAKKEAHWRGSFLVQEPTRPLWLYANVTYQLPEPITGAGYYYRTYTTDQLTISSKMETLTRSQLERVGVHGRPSSQSLIEVFNGSWRKQWFTYLENEWPIRTHKIYEPKWSAPSDNSKLLLKLRSELPNKLVIGIDDFVKEVTLEGGNVVEEFSLSHDDFINGDGKSLKTWSGTKELRLGHLERLRSSAGTKLVGGGWKGKEPQFILLKWK